jgi:hypothetical protein
MTLTKIYKYQIKPGCETAYQRMQQQVALLYRKHAEVEFLFLSDSTNRFMKTEVIRLVAQDKGRLIVN